MLLRNLSSTDVALEQIFDRIGMFALQIHRCFDLSEILSLTVQEVREVLESDRAVIYRFLSPRKRRSSSRRVCKSPMATNFGTKSALEGN